MFLLRVINIPAAFLRHCAQVSRLQRLQLLAQSASPRGEHRLWGASAGRGRVQAIPSHCPAQSSDLILVCGLQSITAVAGACTRNINVGAGRGLGNLILNDLVQFGLQCSD